MIQRGFPKDLPVRPAHALQLDWWVTQRNFINLWLPEGVMSDGGKVVWFLLRDPTDLRWSHDQGIWESRFAMEGRCEVVARVAPREDGIDLCVRVKNLSESAWPGTHLAVCVQLATAPDFRDPGLERTYFPAPGGWRKFEAGTVKQVYPGGCHFYGVMNSGETAQLDRAEIRVASQCGRWFLSHFFREAVSVGGNCHETICCVHANPVLGPLAPGATKETTGWLRVRNEPVNSPPLQ
jgi:hypothetical protein